jgi:hypothetical protein
MMKITNPLREKETDSLGMKVIKAGANGYIKGLLVSGATIGAISLIGVIVDKVVNSEEEVDETIEEEETVEKEVTKKAD